MKDFYLTQDEYDKDLKKEETDKEICKNCSHFDKSLFSDNGKCVCVMSKYYSDIMGFNNKCDYFYGKGNKK